ncbi:GNAT family N-acetyltransferase [uncultured Tateyamaria sp.]|uniref:GNAT family N-acetyltransferase n=1 Tax=uncultured Tateyamaria sp. TaxID=455651 RepID=UPI002624D54C|nr:GNAT family N-acetyltransferase [uncultured Tateyamaria sp.]
MRVETLTGPALTEALDDVAKLRLAVFRDWPYLYEGDITYERRYLEVYEQSDRAVIVAAYDGDWMVGAATAAPLAEHADAFGDAFAGSGVDIDTCFYCGESVLLPRFRGRGVGHTFFDRREAHARDLGYSQMCFASVIRSRDHPLYPSAYRSLESFWEGRGYTRIPGVVSYFAWRDVDHGDETEKPLQFWIRDL